MRKTWQRILWGLAVLALTLALGAFVLIKSADPEALSRQLSSFVKRLTGLELLIAGDVRLQFHPWLGVELRQATLVGLAGFEKDPFVRVERLAVRVSPVALLQRRLEADTLLLDGLHITLIRDPQGRFNFQSLPVRDVRVDKEHVIVETRQGETVTFSYVLQGATIERGGILFDDRLAGQRYTVENLSLRCGRVVSGQPFKARLGFDLASSAPAVRGRVDLSGQIEMEPQRLFFGFRDTRLTLTLAGEKLPVAEAQATLTGKAEIDAKSLRFTGADLALKARLAGGRLPAAGTTVRGKGALVLDLGLGTLQTQGVQLSAASLQAEFEASLAAVNTTPQGECLLRTNTFAPRQLAAQLGFNLPEPTDATALQALSVTAKASLTPSLLTIELTPLKLDSTTLKATLSATRTATPRSSVAASLDKLDLDRYLPKRGAQAANHAHSKPNAASPAPEKNGTIDLTALRKLNLDARLEAKELVAHGLPVHDLSLTCRASDGVLRIDPLHCTAAQGAIKATFQADAGGITPAFSMQASGTGVQLEPLLSRLANFSRLTGTGGFESTLATRGLELEALLAALDGQARISLRQGAIQGFSLSPDIFKSPLHLLKSSLSSGSTPIQSASGSFDIKNGVARSKDLIAVSDPHKATGTGRIDLAKERLNLNLQVHFLNLASIPITVSGSFQNPDVSADTSALAGKAVQGAVEGALDGVVDALSRGESGSKAVEKGLRGVLQQFMGKEK